MKTALPALFFLLLTFTNASELVYDTEGEPISEAYSYKISIGRGLGRAYFTLPNNGSYPLPVIAAVLSPDNPLPLPVKFKNNLQFPYPYAFTDTPLNFTFAGIRRCEKASQWFAEARLGSYAWSLMFGDDTERLAIEGDFIVKDYGEKYSYKIIFFDKDSQNSFRNLALRDDWYLDIVDGNVTPLEIRFEKLNSDISMVV